MSAVKPPPTGETENSRRRFLLGARQHAEPRMEIGAACLARHGVYCESCRDACDPQAIQFLRRAGAVPVPVVDLAACTACGDCVTICPAQAIVVNAQVTEHHHG